MKFRNLTVAEALAMGFGFLMATLVVVAVAAISKVRRIYDALRANSEEYTSIQRYAINFRGSAHDRSIATRNVVPAANAADRQAAVDTMQRLARFYAESAGPLENLPRACGTKLPGCSR